MSSGLAGGSGWGWQASRAGGTGGRTSTGGPGAQAIKGSSHSRAGSAGSRDRDTDDPFADGGAGFVSLALGCGGGFHGGQRGGLVLGDGGRRGGGDLGGVARTDGGIVDQVQPPHGGEHQPGADGGADEKRRDHGVGSVTRIAASATSARPPLVVTATCTT